jgi:hypothetical protein
MKIGQHWGEDMLSYGSFTRERDYIQLKSNQFDSCSVRLRAIQGTDSQISIQIEKNNCNVSTVKYGDSLMTIDSSSQSLIWFSSQNEIHSDHRIITFNRKHIKFPSSLEAFSYELDNSIDKVIVSCIGCPPPSFFSIDTSFYCSKGRIRFKHPLIKNKEVELIVQ